MVAESISKYETRAACGQAGLHSCGGLAHKGLKGKFSVQGQWVIATCSVCKMLITQSFFSRGKFKHSSGLLVKATVLFLLHDMFFSFDITTSQGINFTFKGTIYFILICCYRSGMINPTHKNHGTFRQIKCFFPNNSKVSSVIPINAFK